MENEETVSPRGENPSLMIVDECAYNQEEPLKMPKVKPRKFKRIGDMSGRKIKVLVMNLLEEQAYIKDYKDDYGTEFGLCWFSKESDTYLTHVGMENDLGFLIPRGIDEHLDHGLGFSTKSQKWYGWSHRAVYGFGIGSSVKPGDCAFQPSSKEEFEERHISFWGDDNMDEEGGYTTTTLDVKKNMLGSHYEETSKDDLVPGISLITETKFHGKQAGRKSYITKHWDAYPESYGKGSWTATSLEEAKEMAIAFKSDVS